MSKGRTVSSFLIVVCLMGFVALGTFHFLKSKEEISVRIEKNKNIGIVDPVIFNFSDSIETIDFEKKISITPEVSVRYEWSDENKKLSIIPESNWGMEEKYEIKMEELEEVMFEKGKVVKSIFFTEEYPKVVSSSPKSGDKNVVLDIEDPMIVEFNKSVLDFDLKLNILPVDKVVQKISEDGKAVSFVFEKGYEKGKTYKVGLNLKNKNDKEGSGKNVMEVSFETEAPSPSEWGKDFGKRLEQAKKYTQPKINSGKYVDINLSQQILSIFENGKILDAFLISSGKRGMDTPKGTFRISNKSPRPWSKQYSLYMPYWMAIVPSGKFGIHELPEWPNGYKEGQNHLGIPVSHGCVRLGIGPARRVYEWTEIGTPVVIY